MLCKIDHAQPGALPVELCRQCHPQPLRTIVLDPAGQVWDETIQTSRATDMMLRDNLTDADRKAIEEIRAGDKRKAKKAESLATMKAKAEDKLNADAGGRWDARLARWVTDEEELALAKKRIRQNAAARRKLKRVARKPRERRKVDKR